MKRRALSALGVASLLFVHDARAGGAGGPTLVPQHRFVDGVAVRFTSAETGGSSRPRFVTQRVLAFEARLLASSEEGAYAEPLDRHVRSAVELHVAIEMLSRLPLDPEPDEIALARVALLIEGATVDRVGGRAALDAIGSAEGIDATEMDALFVREARAALYVERAITPVLYPSVEVLRDVFRTSAHPYRGKKWDEAREPLARWFALERLRAVETQFLQNARARVHIVFL